MSERNLDFDKITDRYNTLSLKYDYAARRGMPEGLLPLWVADIDFPTSSYIQDALKAQTEHGIFGYSEPLNSYFEALAGWMKSHHGYEFKNNETVRTPGIVMALAMAVKAFTKEGDGVLIQTPVYYPFYEVIEDNRRVIVRNPLKQNEEGRYCIDFEDFEKKISENGIKLFLLCNPHNPGGSVWTAAELLKIGEICEKHGVIVVSDEIHADYVFKGKHTVFEKVKESFKDFTITCTSPSKTFNLAGLQISNIFIKNPAIRRAFRKEIDAAGYSQLGVMGLVAAEAAYRHGEEWYLAAKKYIYDNILFTEEYIRKNIPGIKMIRPEGTYLVWLDCKGLGLSDDELDRLIINKARLWLDSGKIFGDEGKGFQRINVAAPRKLIEQALGQLSAAVNTL
ncbi:MAG: pyridoxal phosphate-dependent aminotransferase [Lachnospiraceae bacterium]|nr:pyridoxal phosphate-dependent aminotransferase [Lachnospiraceae bacterium]